MDLTHILLFLPGLILLGSASGFLAGLLGVGGGLILVPGLFFGFTAAGFSEDHMMHMAVATSIAIIIPTGVSSVRAHAKRQAVRRDILRMLAPGIILGVCGGMGVAAMISGDGMRIFFAAMLLFFAILMLIDPARMAVSDRLPRQPFSWLAGAVIGSASSLMGIGGATLSVPFMSFCKVSIHHAVGTASAIGLIISVPAMLGYMLIGAGQQDMPPFTIGYVNLLAAGLIAPFSFLVAPLGAKAAHAAPRTVLRLCFSFFLILVSCRMFYDVLFS